MLDKYYKITNSRRYSITVRVMLYISILIFLFSYRIDNFNLSIYSTFLSIISLYLMNKKEDILIRLFFIVYIVFLLNMPLLDTISGNQWWISEYDVNKLKISLNLLFISPLLIQIGYSYRVNKQLSMESDIFDTMKYKIEKNFLLSLTKKKTIFLIFLAYGVTYIASLYVEIDKLIFMKEKLYEEFYKSYQINYPSYISIIANFNIYYTLLLLAIRPKKKISIIILILHIIKTIPMLMIGKRSPFMIALLFAFIYFLLRDLKEDEQEIWFGKSEKILCLISFPILLSLMTMINYSRSGFETHGIKIFPYIRDFFYRQGISFKVITIGIENQEKIAAFSPHKNFLFGEIIDLLKYGRLSRIFFNSPELPLGNSVYVATQSSAYAHSLAFISHPGYLKGEGYGSSYILEAFQTYGYLGVLLVNVFLGRLFKWIKSPFTHSIPVTLICLLIIEKLYFIPRASFSSLFLFMFNPNFILFIVSIILFILASNFFEKGKTEK